VPASACSVAWVEPKGPMAAAGLKPNDLILDFDGKTYKDVPQLGEAMSEKMPGKPVRFHVLREGETLELTATPKKW